MKRYDNKSGISKLATTTSFIHEVQVKRCKTQAKLFYQQTKAKGAMNACMAVAGWQPSPQRADPEPQYPRGCNNPHINCRCQIVVALGILREAQEKEKDKKGRSIMRDIAAQP